MEYYCLDHRSAIYVAYGPFLVETITFVEFGWRPNLQLHSKFQREVYIPNLLEQLQWIAHQKYIVLSLWQI